MLGHRDLSTTDGAARAARRRPIVVIVLATAIAGMMAAAVLGVLRAERTEAGLDSVRALARGRQFRRAIALLQGYLRTHPDDAGGRLLMGQLATEPGDPHPDLALEHLAAVRPRDPRQAALVRVFEGKAQYQKGRYDLAELAWTEALRRDPIAPEAGWLLLALLDQEGRLTEAHALGMRLHEIEPDPLDRVRLLLEMARLDIDTVAPASQVLLFGPVARQHPEHLALSLTLGRALVLDSRGAEGLEVLESARRRHPDVPEAWEAWLSGLAGAHQLDRLAEEFARLPGWMARDPRFAQHEGLVARNERDWPRAVRAFRRATEHEPSNAVLWYHLRAALRQVGDTAELDRVHRWYTSFEQASQQMRPAYLAALATPNLGVSPHPALYHRLADLRQRMGRPDEARAWHRLVLRDDPSDAISLAAMKRLESAMPPRRAP